MTRWILALFAPFALAACATLPPAAEAPVKPFVIAANPLAAQAGMDVLDHGGSAADAALAVQAMLSLVEPQSSGMGGGGFLHYYDGRTGDLLVYDGREAAPMGAAPTMFLGDDGEPLDFRDAVVSGRATGVPGALAALASVHDDHGKLPFSSLFDTSIATAAGGFTISPRLGQFLQADFPQLSQADAKAYFANEDGSRKNTGDLLRNRPYADFLRRLASEGPDALYRGETARRIVEKTTTGPLPGTMTLADLADYRIVKRDPLCTWYDRTRICAPPPPSSGVAFLELMELLERTAISETGPDDPRSWYLFAEASRLMYADRDKYVGDVPDVPIAGMLDDDYLDARARLIEASAATKVVAGTPPGAPAVGPDATMEPAGTSHFIVRDADGNVISMTTTVESIFGTGRMVDGFFLNNQLTDFSFSPVDDDGLPVPNAVAPGKHPRSSMVPLILTDELGRFKGAIGSAGGNSIPAYVGKSLIAALDWGLPMQDALALPNIVARGDTVGVETSKIDPRVIAEFQARGMTVASGQGEDSGVHGVLIREGGRVDGGFDPRREGTVLVGN